ncbi:MAG: hypothetical protein ACE5JI_09230 [Acidobacteriota bacterium]
MVKKSRSAAMAGALGRIGTILGVLILLAGCDRVQDPSTESAGAPASRSPPLPRGRARAQEPPDVDLRSLLAEVPEYEGQGRNLFAYGKAPAQAEPPSDPEPNPPPPVASNPPRPRRTKSSPPPRIDLKFAGFVEKSDPGGGKKKYAILLDGADILAGAEGDLVGNRYKIVQIGLESVTVGVEGSSVTQKIPLRSN